jgi:hypothetical protein
MSAICAQRTAGVERLLSLWEAAARAHGPANSEVCGLCQSKDGAGANRNTPDPAPRERSKPCLRQVPKPRARTGAGNLRRPYPSLTRSDADQGSPEITRVYSTVTLGVVATPKTGTTVVGPLAARPM